MVQFLGKGRNFLSSTEYKLPLRSTIQSPIQKVSGAMSLAVKQLGHEADHPTPCAEVQNVWDFVPQSVFKARCLIKYMESLPLFHLVCIINLKSFGWGRRHQSYVFKQYLYEWTLLSHKAVMEVKCECMRFSTCRKITMLHSGEECMPQIWYNNSVLHRFVCLKWAFFSSYIA